MDCRGRLLIVVPRFPPAYGGAELFTYQIAKIMVREGIDVTVMTMRLSCEHPEEEMVDNIRVLRIGKGNWGIWGSCISLPASIFRNRNSFDSILIVGVDLYSFSSALTGKAVRKRIAVRPATSLDLHPTPPELQYLFKSRFVRATYGMTKRLIIRMLILFADLWIALSDEILDEMKNAGIDSNRIQKIPNGVDTERFSPINDTEKEELKERFQIPDGSIVLLYCGRIVKRKRLELLLNAFSTLVREHSEIHLLIVGSGNMQPDSTEEEVEKAVTRFPGNLTWVKNASDTSIFYQMADIFVLPSEREGMPNVLLEAMSTGLACIASSIGGVVDILDHESDGLLFFRESNLLIYLKHLLIDTEHRKFMGKFAREKILHKFNIVDSCGQYIHALIGR